MGEPLDSTRESRFPRTPPRHTESQQTNLRELEEAIYWLQDQKKLLESLIASQSTLIATLTTRIETLEKSNG